MADFARSAHPRVQSQLDRLSNLITQAKKNGGRL